MNSYMANYKQCFMICKYLRPSDLQEIGLAQIPQIILMVKPLDENQECSQLQDHSPWLVCEVA